MVLVRNQQPTPGCVRCSQPSEAAYFKYYPNYGTLKAIHVYLHFVELALCAAAGRNNLV